MFSVFSVWLVLATMLPLKPDAPEGRPLPSLLLSCRLTLRLGSLLFAVARIELLVKVSFPQVPRETIQNALDIM